MEKYNQSETILAAGGLLWRRREGGLLIALVHRPKYNDWSLPKGKAKNGEDKNLEDTALREVWEETGWTAELLSPAGETRYRKNGKEKLVKFWNMTALKETGSPDPDEIDEMVWVVPEKAIKIMSYGHEREIVLRNGKFISDEIY